MDIVYQRDKEIALSEKEKGTDGILPKKSTTQAVIQMEDLVDMNVWGGLGGKSPSQKVVVVHGNDLFNETEQI